MNENGTGYAPHIKIMRASRSRSTSEPYISRSFRDLISLRPPQVTPCPDLTDVITLYLPLTSRNAQLTHHPASYIMGPFIVPLMMHLFVPPQPLRHPVRF